MSGDGPAAANTGGSRRPPVTIYDVARLTGVSPSTVSRALNKPGRISADTEQRIRVAATSLGYRLNPAARALPTGKTGTVAIILSDIRNPVYFDLLRGAEQVAAASGHTLVFADSQESAAVELTTAQRLQPAVDGLVLVASRLSDPEIHELDHGTPLVLVNRQVGAIAAVIPDVSPGLAAAADHLRALGHSSIGYLAGPGASWMNRLRWETLVGCAAARNMSIVKVGCGDPTLAGGRAALREVLASGVTAIVAYNDLMAMGLIQECRSTNVPVPQALSIVGFDDIFGAELMSPALSTIRSPLAEMGGSAVRRLLGQLDGVESAPSIDLETRFVPRDSTSAPRVPAPP